MFFKLILLLFSLTYPDTVLVGATEVPDTDCSCMNSVVVCPSMNLQTVPSELCNDLNAIILDGNNIQTVTKMDFAALNNLITLSLSNNLISSIDNGSFSDLVNLETLLLDNNLLTVLLPSHLFGLTSLRSLILHGNLHLVIDPCLFSDLVSLTTLSLQQTQVDLNDKLVTSSTACPPHPQMPTRYPYVETLQSLSIGHEETSSEANTLQNFESLRRITLFNFTEESFDNSDLSNLEKLEEVLLLHVPVYPVEFLRSNSLTKLTIAHSTFISLPRNALKNVRSLQSFSLFNSSLSRIEEGAFSGAPNLTDINLSFNKLFSLPEGIFHAVGGGSSALPKMLLSGNEWHCDCKLKWLQERLISDPSKVISVVCRTPSDKAGMPISNVHLDCESITMQPNVNHLKEASTKIITPTEIITHHRYTDTTILTDIQPSHQTSILVYILAAAGAAVLMSLIVILIICVFVKKKKQRQEPSPPSCNNETICEEDNYYSKVSDRAVYDRTINTGFNERNFPGLALSEQSSSRQTTPNEYLKHKSNTLVEGRRPDDSPDYMNTRRGHFTLGDERKKKYGRTPEVDHTLYLNTTPKYPHLPNSPTQYQQR